MVDYEKMIAKEKQNYINTIKEIQDLDCPPVEWRDENIKCFLWFNMYI